jgi:hypothetical protein
MEFNLLTAISELVKFGFETDLRNRYESLPGSETFLFNMHCYA